MSNSSTEADCSSYRIIGIGMTVIMLASASLNTFLLLNMIKQKNLRRPINTFVVALTVLNLIGTFVEMPIAIASLFKCSWVFGFLEYDCSFFGFTMYTVGATSIAFMVWISISRFMIVYRPQSIQSVTYLRVGLGIKLSISYGVFWSTAPLFGWSHYSLESNKLFCSVEWKERSFNVLSYNFCMFLFVFIIPLLIISVTSIKILKIVHNSQSNTNSKKAVTENRTSRNLVLFNIIYLVSWTPYAVKSFSHAFNIVEKIPPILEVLSCVFAKSSMLSSAIFFIYSYRDIKLSYTYSIEADMGKRVISLISLAIPRN